jgi:hypothetical protein
MKKLILILLLLLTATGYAAKDTRTWNYKLKSRSVVADTVHGRGVEGSDTLFVNLFDLVFGTRAEFTHIDVDTLTVEAIGDTCANGNWAFAISTTCVPYIGFEADSQKVAREEAIDDSLDNYPTTTYAQALIRDSIYAHSGQKIVPLINVDNSWGARSGVDTSRLETAVPDSISFIAFVIGGAIDAKGWFGISATIPEDITQIDSVWIGFLTSSDDTTISAIDSIRAYVTTDKSKMVHQGSYSTTGANLASTGMTGVWWIFSDGDFNSMERMRFQFFVRNDAAAWIGITNCFAVMQ